MHEKLQRDGLFEDINVLADGTASLRQSRCVTICLSKETIAVKTAIQLEACKTLTSSGMDLGYEKDLARQQ